MLNRAALCGLLVAACGSDDSGGGAGLASCIVTTTVGAITVQLCVETSGGSAAQIQQSCTSQFANLSDAGTVQVVQAAGPCSRVDALGGCSLGQPGGAATIWYYRNAVDGGVEQTSEDIRMLCSQVGGTFVPP